MTAPTEAKLRFFAGAMEILAVEGYGHLKVRRLCRQVGVTTGAFYHSFDSWQGFTGELLDHWHTERTLRVAELAAQELDPRGRIELLLRSGVELPHAAEAAIRVWAGVDPEVRTLQAAVDRERVETVAAAFRAHVGDPDVATRLARSAFYAVVGYEQADGERDATALEHLLRQITREADEIAAGTPTPEAP